MVKRLAYAFTKEGELKEELDLIVAVRREFPELAKVQEYWPTQGDYGHVAFLGDYVIKSPNPKEYSNINKAVTEFKKEFAYQQKLSHLSLVPKIINISERFNICVMQKMPGVALEKTNHYNMKDDQIEKIAKTLAQFCSDISKALPAEDYPEEPIQDKDFELIEKIRYIKNKLEETALKTFLGNERHKEYTALVNAMGELYKEEPIMSHCDLSDSNILVNPNKIDEITGIIDFGRLYKCIAPEKHPSLNNLGINIREAFDRTFYKVRNNKNGYSISAMDTAFEYIYYTVSEPEVTSENLIKTTDALVIKSKMI